MPRHTRRKLAKSYVVRAAEKDASDDESTAINAPGGDMVPRDAPAFPGTGWIPSDLVFRPDWHLSQRPRAGMADEKPCRTYWSLVEVQRAFKALRADEEAMEIWSQTGLADFQHTMGGTVRCTSNSCPLCGTWEMFRAITGWLGIQPPFVRDEAGLLDCTGE
ncbi:hypothetical protein SOVF_101460 [Spinacia oleracea]|nr:hypothetical protein SOVF_101460 [Spinacia oleracea]